MELKLTNEQLALFFDKNLKGDTLDYGYWKFRISNPVLHIENLYDDYVDWDFVEDPIGSSFDKTILVVGFPLDEGFVYDTLILFKKGARIDSEVIVGDDQTTKFDDIEISIPWDTYYFGTGQDVVEVENENIEIPQIRNDATVTLSLTLERIVDDTATFDELLDDDIPNESKIEILNGSTIHRSEYFNECMQNLIEMLNNELDEDIEEEYLYMEKDEEIIIIKAPINDSLLSLEEDFGQYNEPAVLKFKTTSTNPN